MRQFWPILADLAEFNPISAHILQKKVEPKREFTPRSRTTARCLQLRNVSVLMRHVARLEELDLLTNHLYTDRGKNNNICLPCIGSQFGNFSKFYN